MSTSFRMACSATGTSQHLLGRNTVVANDSAYLAGPKAAQIAYWVNIYNALTLKGTLRE